MPPAIPSPVVVIGGGITGLAAAHRLRRNGVPVLVIERETRLGGKILTEHRGGFVIEGGPDAFLSSKPHGRELCAELGVDLIGSNQDVRRAFVMRDGRLYPLPDGFTGVMPRRLRPMLTTRLLSPAGKLRLAMEWFIPARRAGGDESLASIVRRRAGRQVWERLVEPLVTGVYAGDGERLSARATFAMLPDAEQTHGGLIRAGRAARRAGTGATPTALLFSTPHDGLGALVGALAEAIGPDAIRTGSGVERIHRDGTDWVVTLTDGETVAAAGVLLTTPAGAAAELVAQIDPILAGELRAIEYVSTATVSMAFPNAAITRPLGGHGFVLPRREGSPIIACTITSTKFPHRAPTGWTLVRAFVGRAGMADATQMDDPTLIGLATGVVGRALGVRGGPDWTRVVRWPDAMPQYTIGHRDRITRITERVAALPGLELAGNIYRGIGIPDCIASGQEAAAAFGPVT